MKKLQLVLSCVLAVIIASFVFAGFAALGLAIVGISFAVLACAAIYRSWLQYKYKKAHPDPVVSSY